MNEILSMFLHSTSIEKSHITYSCTRVRRKGLFIIYKNQFMKKTMDL